MVLTVSIVVPVFNNEHTIRELHRRIAVVAAERPEAFEVVFVDDASPDGSWAVIRSLAETDSRVRGLRLADNVGQARAVFAGMEAASGEVMVLMDADLDHPPEFVPALLGANRAGHDFIVVSRRYLRRPRHRRLASVLFTRLARVAGLPGDDAGSSFILLDRAVERAVRHELERTGTQMITPTAFWAAQRPCSLPLHASATVAGFREHHSSYSPVELVGIGGNFFCHYLAPRFARTIGWGALMAVVLSARPALRRTCMWAAAVLSAIAAVLVCASRLARRDPAAPLYVVAEECGASSTATRV